MALSRKTSAAARPAVRRVSGGRAVDRRREFNVLVERDDAGWYVATVPELRGCHTQARSLDALMVRVREAIELCLETDQGGNAPVFVALQRISLDR